jgi:hypothetical protein
MRQNLENSCVQVLNYLLTPIHECLKPLLLTLDFCWNEKKKNFFKGFPYNKYYIYIEYEST